MAGSELLSSKELKNGGKLDQDVSRVLEQHRQLQEGLTDEMVELARAIKNNSLAMEQSMKETGKVSLAHNLMAVLVASVSKKVSIPPLFHKISFPQESKHGVSFSRFIPSSGLLFQ